MPQMPGRFITLEGGEAAGKSTQIHFLKKYLEKHGKEVITTREPGGTPGAEKIRSLLKEGHAHLWDGISETLLFYAARRDHVENVIKPALSQGKWVISDRFADSTRIYQVYGRGIDPEIIEKIHTLTLGSFEPDITFILEIPPSLSATRMKSRSEKENKKTNDRFEDMDFDFHTRLYEGFHLMGLTQKRCALIDSTIPIKDVSFKLAKLLEERFLIPFEEEAFHDALS